MGVVIGTAFYFLSPKIWVSQCDAVARLTEIYNGESMRSFIGLLQKKKIKQTNRGVWGYGIPRGIEKIAIEEFPGVNLKQSEISRGDQEKIICSF